MMMSTSSTISYSVLIFAIFIVLLLTNKSDADPYGGGGGSGALVPSPPNAVAGKELHRQRVFCNSPLSKCFKKTIKCPKQCPSVKPFDPTHKACFVDCNSKNCEPLCKTRRPNCEGIGAACYDPRFVGGDGVMFYFHGKANQHFSLVSDSNFQINARFIGRRPQGRTRDNTWIQALGLVFTTSDKTRHSFTLEANKVAEWDSQVDQLLFTYDGSPITIPTGHLSSWAAPSNIIPLAVERTASWNSVTVTLPGVVEMSVRVVPITKEDDRVHNYQIPSDDCFAHLETQFKFLHLSEEVEGVLGQTYRPDFQSPVKRGVAMPIMGGEHKYSTDSLVSTRCERCIFSSFSSAKSLLLAPDTTMDCSSRSNNGRGLVCRR